MRTGKHPDGAPYQLLPSTFGHLRNQRRRRRQKYNHQINHREPVFAPRILLSFVVIMFHLFDLNLFLVQKSAQRVSRHRWLIARPRRVVVVVIARSLAASVDGSVFHINHKCRPSSLSVPRGVSSYKSGSTVGSNSLFCVPRRHRAVSNEPGNVRQAEAQFLAVTLLVPCNFIIISHKNWPTSSNGGIFLFALWHCAKMMLCWNDGLWRSPVFAASRFRWVYSYQQLWNRLKWFGNVHNIRKVFSIWLKMRLERRSVYAQSSLLCYLEIL